MNTIFGPVELGGRRRRLWPRPVLLPHWTHLLANAMVPVLGPRVTRMKTAPGPLGSSFLVGLFCPLRPLFTRDIEMLSADTISD